jgi:hypothetical protein
VKDKDLVVPFDILKKHKETLLRKKRKRGIACGTVRAERKEFDEESLPRAEECVVEGAAVRSDHSHHLCTNF